MVARFFGAFSVLLGGTILSVAAFLGQHPLARRRLEAMFVEPITSLPELLTGFVILTCAFFAIVWGLQMVVLGNKL